MPGKNSVLHSESSENMSTVLYKISKKRSGNVFIQCLNTYNVSLCIISSDVLFAGVHHLSIKFEYSGNVSLMSDVKSLYNLLKDLYLN
jgi:hypothetical protein